MSKIEAETNLVKFEADDFSTGKPYAYLYGIKDRFAQQQEIERLRKQAKAIGMLGEFTRMWKGYVSSQSASPDVYQALNVASLTGLDIKMKTGPYEVNDNDGVILPQQPPFPDVIICPHPIVPTRRIVNLDTGEYKVELRFKRGDEKEWRTVIFDKAIMASAQKIVMLANCGISVTSENARGLVTYLAAMEALNYNDIPEVRSVGRLGWVKGYGFSPYVSDLMFDGVELYRHAFEAVHPCGNFDTWLDFAKKARAGQSVALRVMLAASFASALVGPLNALPFMVHCWSSVAGIGKTVGLMLAASVWASPEVGNYVKTFNSTSVGLEMMAGFCGSLPLCIDELCLKDGRRDQFDSMIYNYCEGAGKMRGSRNGGLQRTLTWHNCSISTGEEPLTSSSSKAGAVNRVLDINAGSERMFDDPRAAVLLLTKNYGHAGKRFIESLLQAGNGFAELLQLLQSFYSEQMEGKATDKQVLSASLVLAADHWATDHIFMDDRALTVDEILPMLQTPDSANVNKRCYEWLIDIVGANPSRFEPREDGTYVGECWGVTEWDEKQVYIIKSIFDRLLKDEGFNSTGFLQWAGREKLIRRDNGHTTISKRVNGGRVLRCVCLKIRDPDDEGEEQQETGNSDGFTPVMDETLPF